MTQRTVGRRAARVTGDMSTSIPLDERRARDLLRALRLMGPNGEGFDALLSDRGSARPGDGSRWLAPLERG